MIYKIRNSWYYKDESTGTVKRFRSEDAAKKFAGIPVPKAPKPKKIEQEVIESTEEVNPLESLSKISLN